MTKEDVLKLQESLKASNEYSAIVRRDNLLELIKNYLDLLGIKERLAHVKGCCCDICYGG